MRCRIVDVFAERPLTGNPLAVVRDAGGLDTAGMQAIAREMNLSETSFVVAEGAGEARVRIFTTAGELPFAGHPVLGTAWVLAREAGREDWRLDVPAGRVAVTFRADGMGWLQAPPVTLAAALDRERAAALVGVAATDLDDRYPCRLASVGPRFVLVGVRNLAVLGRLRIDPELCHALADGRFLGVFVHAPAGEGAGEGETRAGRFRARMFFQAGRREDPATGSANAAFAAHLRQLGVRGRVVVEQGIEIGRPSRIHLDVADPVRVGGHVRPVLTGRLDY